MIKFIMKTCEEFNIICEADGGTVLGAVKFNKVLPWEKDADFTFLTSNFTSLKQLEPIIARKYRVKTRERPRRITSQKRYKANESFLDGQLIQVPRNPGYFLRNEFGNEIYAHAEHWSVLEIKQAERYKSKTFASCPTSGRHDCLDTYNVDGNLQFTTQMP
ncbi:FKRP [Mytilus coruscus]|uniref:FKRP n=1 Tax=Mytilus coruscus TaxID=42192 RepID=A0A6J8DRZ2_MYTCO|nr:FKRP [Mytilus coruscus]